MPGNSTAYKAGLIVSIIGLLVVFAAALVPIYDSLSRWFKYGTPDNLGLGLGFVVILFFGTPLLILLYVCKAGLSRLDDSQSKDSTG